MISKDDARPGAILEVLPVIRNGLPASMGGSVEPSLPCFSAPGAFFDGTSLTLLPGDLVKVAGAPKRDRNAGNVVELRAVRATRNADGSLGEIVETGASGWAYWCAVRASTRVAVAAPPPSADENARAEKAAAKPAKPKFPLKPTAAGGPGLNPYGQPIAQTGDLVTCTRNGVLSAGTVGKVVAIGDGMGVDPNGAATVEKLDGTSSLEWVTGLGVMTRAQVDEVRAYYAAVGRPRRIVRDL